MNTESVENGTLNMEQLAKRLGIARGVAYRAAKDGTLPVRVFRVGKRIFVSKAAVEALLADTERPDSAA